MNKVRLTFSFAAAAAFVLSATSLAQAQNPRTWVASTGTDTSINCTRVAPCRTFQGALAKTNKTGEIDVVDPADYSDRQSDVGLINGMTTLTITQAVTIDGGGFDAVLTGGNAENPNFNAVSISGLSIQDAVEFRGVSINGFHIGGSPTAFTNGITFTGNGVLILENCSIVNFSNAAVDFEPSGATGLNQPTGLLFVRSSEFTNNQFGIFIQTGDREAYCSVDGSKISANGVFGTGVGINAQNHTRLDLSNSVFQGNGLVGIQLQPSSNIPGLMFGSIANVENCLVTKNGTGFNVGLPFPALLRLSNVDIFENLGPGFTYGPGSSVASFGNNRQAGNLVNNAPTATIPLL